MASQEEHIAEYTGRVEKAEQEIARLSAELLELSDPAELLKNGAVAPELDKLRVENQKLLFQRKHLKRSLADEEKVKKTCALNIRGVIEDVFTAAIYAAFPEVPNPSILVVPSSKFADYQCNSAMSIAKQLGTITGQKTTPRDVAQAILDNLPQTSFFEKTEIAGPGFINVFVDKEFILKEMTCLLREGVKPPKVKRKRVVIDYSSPNIAKEMHVGHLRSSIVGESLSRLLDWVGHDVLRLNHIGDWGTQFGMLIAHLIDKFPNLLTQRPDIGDLQAFYKESKVRFDSDEDFKRRAMDCVVKLQAYEPFHYKAWKVIYDISMEVNNSLYERLEVSLQERGESFYQKRMEKLVKELREEGLTEVDEHGRAVLFVDGMDVPLMVTKSDGAFTYDTSDLACIKQRIQEEQADWVIYVVGTEQSNHLESIFRAASKLGWLDRSKHRIDHVGFGLVLGEDKKKLKSRSGATIRLRELLDEGLVRVEKTLQDKGRDKELSQDEMEKVKRSVAYGCVKYADLSHNRTHDYVFSYDKMLDDRGNTAAYLLYANTRIRSIARTAQVSPAQLKKAIDTTDLNLDHPAEWKLAKCILRYTEVIVRVLEDLYLHSLCDYLYELTTTFTEFYDKCYCIEKDKDTGKIKKVHMSRLMLCEATAQVISNCFHILGINALEKM